MFKNFLTLFLVVLIVGLLTPIASAESFCTYTDAVPGAANKSSADYEGFDKLLKQTVVTLDTDVSINAFESVSTGTADVTFLPDNVNYPILIKIQNHGTASITYVPYETDVTGITQPTATAGHLLAPDGNPVVNGAAYKKVYHNPPNVSIGTSAEQEVVIDVWGKH